MKKALRVGYYAVATLAFLIIAFFLTANLYGPRSPGETWRHATVVFAGGVAGLAMLAWSFRTGHRQQRWFTGLAIAAAAPFAFALVTFGGLLMFTTIHWQ